MGLPGHDEISAHVRVSGLVVVVLQQLKLSIEKSHNANDGHAKCGGEEHFAEHLFLLVSDLCRGKTIMICWCCLQASTGLKTGHLSQHKLN